MGIKTNLTASLTLLLSCLLFLQFVLRSGRHVVIIATRTILGKSYARSTKTQGIRPRSRTLTAVQDAMLEVNSMLCWLLAHFLAPCADLNSGYGCVPIYQNIRSCKCWILKICTIHDHLCGCLVFSGIRRNEYSEECPLPPPRGCMPVWHVEMAGYSASMKEERPRRVSGRWENARATEVIFCRFFTPSKKTKRLLRSLQLALIRGALAFKSVACAGLKRSTGKRVIRFLTGNGLRAPYLSRREHPLPLRLVAINVTVRRGPLLVLLI